MDNDTIVETLKYLNYYQLAKTSLVSKRFWDTIRAYRHSLAFLDVESISMKFAGTFDLYELHRTFVHIFEKIFYFEEYDEKYNEWVIRNQYSKQIPLESQVAGKQSLQNYRNVFELRAYVASKVTNCRNLRTPVFKASAELNHKNFPLLQHFVRLITDPFVYIRWMELIPQNYFFHLLVGAVTSDRERLQCGQLNFDLKFNLKSNNQKFMSWIKNNVRCDVFNIIDCWPQLFCDKELVDFFLTGAHCTSKIYMNCEPSKVITGFVQKFMDLKKCDDYQIVESIKCYVQRRPDEELMGKCGKFIVKEENNRDSTEHFFEFVNNDIGKKSKLTVKTYDHTLLGWSNPHSSFFVLKIENM